MKSITIHKEYSIGTKVLWIIASIVAAVVLPQFVHLLGKFCGVNSKLGEIFLPMHLPIMIAGFLAGPAVGAIAGIIAPIISFSYTNMPSAALLPFMTVELCAYGISAGFLKNAKMNSVLKVITVQLIGRAVRAIVILAAVYLLAFDKIGAEIIWLSIKTGALGIALQIAVIPQILKRAQNDE